MKKLLDRQGKIRRDERTAGAGRSPIDRNDENKQRKKHGSRIVIQRQVGASRKGRNASVDVIVTTVRAIKRRMRESRTSSLIGLQLRDVFSEEYKQQLGARARARGREKKTKANNLTDHSPSLIYDVHVRQLHHHDVCSLFYPPFFFFFGGYIN